MKLPYGYVLINEEIVVHEEKADAVRNIFGYYLYAKGIPSPSGNPKWGRAAVDKLLSNAKYIPIVGMETYMDAQFERDRRCNMDYDKVGHPRKTVRYQSPSLEIN